MAQALDILNSAVFGTSVNGYVLSSDQYAELLALLENSDANPRSAESDSEGRDAHSPVTPAKERRRRR
jgi:hypothetical protein